MTNGGAGGIVFIGDAEENVNRVSTAGRVFTSESFTRIKNHSPVNVTSASGGSEFETVAVGRVILRSESGNGIMWWGGTSDDSPYSGHGMPLWGGESTVPLPVTNFNTLKVVASISGQVVYAIGFLNGEDSILTNTVAAQTPIPLESIPPLVLSHVPVSGLSGVSFNTESTVTFNEEISLDSVVSGSFTLSPAHDVSIYRDLSNFNKIVMTPNVNMSGSTVYFAGVNSAITDVAGNPVSGTVAASGGGPFVWRFTTAAAPPPPDVTAPVVSGTIPVSGASAVSAGTNVLVTFSEPMLSGTVHAQNIYLSYLSGVAFSSGISGSVSLSTIDEKTVTINPTAALLSGLSVVHINVLSGVTDIAGNSLAAHDRSRRFTTAAVDATLPVVSGTSPANLASNINVASNVVITFSEAMMSGTINTNNIYLSTTSGGTADPASYTVSLSGNAIAAEINPTSDLSVATYFINVTTGVQDVAGNAIAAPGDKGRSFTTLYNYQEVYNVTGSVDADAGEGDDTMLGLIVLSSSSALKGSIVKRVTVRLREASGSPTGTITIRIMHLNSSSSATNIAVIGTMSASALTASYADYTFTNLSNTRVMIEGDMIMVEYTGPDTIEIQKTSSNSYNGVDYIKKESDGNFNDDSGADVAMKVYK